MYEELEKKLTATRSIASFCAEEKADNRKTAALIEPMEGILVGLYEANVVLREVEQLRLSVTRGWATMLMLEVR